MFLTRANMDTSPETPLVVTSSIDEQGGPPLVPGPDSDTNFASDPDSKAWVEQNVIALLQHTRSEYGAQHEEWSNIRRMANIVRDANAAYNGQSKAYLPVYQRALETRVSHTSRGLFPSDSYIDNNPVIESPQAEVAKEAVKAWMMWQLETSAKLRAEMKPFMRNLYNYGTSIAKIYWEKPPAEKSTKLKNMGMAGLLGSYGGRTPWQCEGLRFKPRSPFAWYIWPVTVNSVGEASLVFEDIQVSKQFVQEMVRKGQWKEDPALWGQNVTPETNNQIQQGLVEAHSSTETAVDYKQGDLADWRYMTECWFRMPVPAKLALPDEQPGQSVPVKAVIVNGIVVELRRNPFWHQMPPYLMMRLNENQDSFFSIGMGRSAASLQYLINDFANQTNDNGIYALNPVVKANPNLLVGPLEPLKPGRVWNMTDTKDGVAFDRPPIEQTQYGMQMTSMLINYLNDMSGAPAVLQGSGDRGGAKTATGAQLLQSNVKGDLQDIVEEIELRVLMPLMIMAHSLGQQYERDERWFAISGQQKTQFKPGMLELDYMWRWVASSQTTNQQMRAQQMGAFLQLAANPGIMGLLQMQGKLLDPVPVLRKFWEDGLGMRNFDRVIRALTPQEQLMMLMQQQAAAAGGQEGGEKKAQEGAQPGQGEQNPRSTTEQAAGGGGPMVEGEGEAFGAVREEADAMAAMLGGMGGMS